MKPSITDDVRIAVDPTVEGGLCAALLNTRPADPRLTTSTHTLLPHPQHAHLNWLVYSIRGLQGCHQSM